MSTMVTYGRGRGLVVGTGMDTQIGMIAEMIQSYEDEATPLQQKLDGSLGKTLGIACPGHLRAWSSSSASSARRATSSRCS